MKKIVIFYVHNFGWLGHNTRILRIAQKLVQNFWYTVIVLNSGEEQEFLFHGISWIKVIQLPRYEFDNYTITWNSESVFQLRMAIFQKLFSHGLDVESIVVEHFPFGRNFLSKELESFIRTFKHYYKDGNVFSSARDILELENIHKENLNLFDRFLIHSDKKIQFLEGKQIKDIQSRIVYTGYVVHENSIIKSPSRKNHIVLGIWWWQDGYDSVIQFLEKIKKISYPGIIYVSLGNSYSLEKVDFLKNTFWENIIIQRYFENFLELKLEADLVVSMWGYNSLTENLYHKIKTIVYPRETDHEQQIRLETFSKISDYIYDGRILTEDWIVRILESNEILNREDINFWWDYFSASFIANYSKYKYIKIRLTNACNAECSMCGVIRRPIHYNTQEAIEASIRDFYQLGWEIVNFTGWEPTIFPWFWKLLQYTKNLGMKTSVSTNGSMFSEKFLEKLNHDTALLIDFMDISIDGLYEKHDIRRNFRGLFSRIESYLHALMERWIIIHINVTIRNDNLGEVREMFTYFKNMWVHSISFWVVTKSPFHDTTDLFLNEDELRILYLQEKPYIEENSWPLRVSFSPENLEKYFQNESKEEQDYIYPKRVPWERCNFISEKREIRINEDGNLSPCCEIDDFDENIGNIYHWGLLKNIYSARYEYFLQKTFPHISEACRKCKIR